jgi:hypothetical protein
MATDLVSAARAYRHNQKLDRLSRKFADATKGVAGSRAYTSLHPLSLAVASVRVDRAQRKAVNVIVPEAGISKIFAGIRTALQFASGIADEAGLPLRIVALWNAPKGAEARDTINYLAREFDRKSPARTSIHGLEDLPELAVSAEDVWIGTHWTTVHPLDIAARLGLIDSRKVIYLIQDYEPGFYPWSTDFAIARTTYHAGFNRIVNSTPLRDYMKLAEGIDVADDFVFAPSLDLERLQAAAESRRASETVRVLFYGRPSKPRNLFAIGVTSLRLAASEFERQGVPATFQSAGEHHPVVWLASGAQLKALGKVPWNDYFALLAGSDVVLSLQHSPHPSHPPLDAISAGAAAVTNELGGTRRTIHANLTATDPDPVSLSTALVTAALEVRGTTGSSFQSSFLTQLGRPVESVIDSTTNAFVN